MVAGGEDVGEALTGEGGVEAAAAGEVSAEGDHVGGFGALEFGGEVVGGDGEDFEVVAAGRFGDERAVVEEEAAGL